MRVIVRRHTRPPAPPGSVRFDERLSAPWWAWPAAALVVAATVESVHLGHPGVPWWVTALVVSALLALALTRLGRRHVTVLETPDGLRLRVGPATLAERFVAGVSIVPREDKQQALGPELDPRAYVQHRAWIGSLVRVELADPEDPTPYWLFSVRRPEAVRALLDRPRTESSR